MHKDKYLFVGIVTVLIGMVVAQFIMLMTLFDRYDTLKRNAEYQIQKIYDTAQRVSVNERAIRLLRTDVEIHERIIVRGEYIDIDEDMIHD